jgi:hypothetical protein
MSEFWDSGASLLLSGHWCHGVLGNYSFSDGWAGFCSKDSSEQASKRDRIGSSLITSFFIGVLWGFHWSGLVLLYTFGEYT